MKRLCFVENSIFTGRNEVLAKVMFLHVSVILLTGGGTWPGTPPPGRHPPSRQAPPPPGRHPPPLPGRHHPPLQAGRHPPPPGYGQRSAGTHPTGMHTCFGMRITWPGGSRNSRVSRRSGPGTRLLGVACPGCWAARWSGDTPLPATTCNTYHDHYSADSALRPCSMSNLSKRALHNWLRATSEFSALRFNSSGKFIFEHRDVQCWSVSLHIEQLY